MKKVLVLFVCIFISALMLGSIAETIDFSNLSPEELQKMIEDASAALDEKGIASEYPRLSVNELFSIYEKNEAAADLKYTNQLVEIMDNVYDIEKSGKSEYKVSLGDGGLFSSSVICYMKDDQLTKIAELEKGKDTIIRGVCDGDPSWGIIFLKDCEIVE